MGQSRDQDSLTSELERCGMQLGLSRVLRISASLHYPHHAVPSPPPLPGQDHSGGAGCWVLGSRIRPQALDRSDPDDAQGQVSDPSTFMGGLIERNERVI